MFRPIERVGMAEEVARKRPSAAALLKRKQAIHRWTRRAIQLVFFILAPALFQGAFNGIKYLFTQIGLVENIEFTSFVVLLVAALVFTIVFGRFFCGYACAFGSLGDWLFSIFDFIRSKTSIPRVRFPQGLVRGLSLVKYAILAAICIACVLGVWGAVSGWSPWVAFAGFLSWSFGEVGIVSYVLFGLVVVGMIVRERFFCQFLCPMGAVFSLMPVLGFSEFTRQREHCARKCGRCREGCPVSIWPDSDELVHGECVSCGRCADVCPMGNVNLVAIERPEAKAARLEQEAARAAQGAPVAEAGSAALASGEAAIREVASGSDDEAARGAQPPAPRESARDDARARGATVGARPLRKTKRAWRMLRGTETGVVVGKAAALLVVCWLIGATRFLPPPPF